MEAYVNGAGRYKLATDIKRDYQANFLTLHSGHIDSNKYSRLLVNPAASLSFNQTSTATYCNLVTASSLPKTARWDTPCSVSCGNTPTATW